MTTFHWIKELLDGDNPQILRTYARVLPYVVIAGTCWYAALGNFVKDQVCNIYDKKYTSETKFSR